MYAEQRSMDQSVCLSVCLFVCPSCSLLVGWLVGGSFSLSVCLSVSQWVSQLTDQATDRLITLTFCPSIQQSVKRSIYPSSKSCTILLEKYVTFQRTVLIYERKKFHFVSTESEWPVKLARNKAESKLIFQLHVKMATDSFSSLQSKCFSAIQSIAPW